MYLFTNKERIMTSKRFDTLFLSISQQKYKQMSSKITIQIRHQYENSAA